MRNIVRLLAVLTVLLATPVARAADWSITSFRSDITIHTDASITVTEKIEVDFDVNKHGIFRTIPYRYDTDDGGEIAVPIEIQSVRRNGSGENFTTTALNQDLEVKIGDPGRTITGSHRYEIVYTAQAAVNFFVEHDELYWNVTGDDWEVPLDTVEASLTIEAPVDQESIQTRCFTGPTGSTEQACTAVAGDASAFFTSRDFLTVVFGWPKDLVTKPADYDQLRTVEEPKPFSLPPILLWAINLGLPLVVIVWLIRRWLTHGRDPQGKNVVVPEYDPPPGLTPGEMGTLFDEHANHRDVVATIVDLAVRGYLTINEIETDKFLGLGKSKDYRLDKTTGTDAAKLKLHEQKLMDGLFQDGDSVSLSALKGSFHADVKAIQADLYNQVRDEGFFHHNPNTVRTAYVGVGIVIAFLGFFAIGLGIFGVIIAGAAVAIAGPFMPKRTSQGAEAARHAKGFKLFLERAEKYRLQWQEKEHIFESYLPYAMAFGVAEKWSKTFEGIQQAPPGWYHGAPGAHFNSIMLWSALNNFSTNTVRSFSPPAASGGSGFGGGGFSGGGFGGGGGGSW